MISRSACIWVGTQGQVFFKMLSWELLWIGGVQNVLFFKSSCSSSEVETNDNSFRSSLLRYHTRGTRSPSPSAPLENELRRAVQLAGPVTSTPLGERANSNYDERKWKNPGIFESFHLPTTCPDNILSSFNKHPGIRVRSPIVPSPYL
jgi:hypothetical protein